jgi:transcription factor IIIB subunit 2
MLVAAACLYAVSRRSNSAVLLIDFAEQLGCDVFSIGRTFIELCHTMTLDIPPIEPYFYIRRFCTQLGFGKETKDVQNTAHKLIACMNRDWMSHGRRPAGICAIAILISARMHKFSITQEEVANVSRLCSATISKRYQEFQQTQVASMSLDEFERHVSQLNNPEYKRQYKESDPPAFSKSKAEQFAEIMANMDKIQQEMNARKGVEKPVETAPPPVEKTSEKAVAPEEEIVISTEDEEEVDVGRLEDLEDAELLHYLVNNMNDQRTRDQMFEQEYGAHIREMEKKKQEKLERLAEQGDKPRRKRKLKEEHTDVATQSLAEAAASTRKKEMIMSRGHALQPFVPSNYAITPDMEPLSEVDDAYNELSSNRDDGFDHYFENIDTTLSRPKKRARMYDDDEYL